MHSVLVEGFVDNSEVRLVNSDGEIIGTIESGDRILRSASTEFLKETIPWMKGVQFIKVFRSNFLQIAPKLSGGAVVVMSMIAPYIAYRSNLVCKGANGNNGAPLNNEDIEEVTGYSKPTVIKIMDELVTHKVLARTKVGHSYQYYANPYIYCCGTRINKTLEAMFRTYKG